MEKKKDYAVTSNPNDDNSDSDSLNDFSEFLNGSDPKITDTDGDSILDHVEVANGYNVTGIEGTPPQVTNLETTVDLVYGGPLGWLGVPTGARLRVDFDITDNVGVDEIAIRVTRMFGTVVLVRTLWLAGDTSQPISETFPFTFIEAVGSGADVNITAYDVNGNGAWGQYHIDSLFEAVVKAILAFFEAVAKVIMEAVSAAFDWIWDAIKSVMRPVAEAFLGATAALSASLWAAMGSFISTDEAPTFSAVDVATAMDPVFLTSPLIILTFLMVTVAVSFLALMTPVMYALPFLLAILPPFIAILIAALVVQLDVPSEATIDPSDSRIVTAEQLPGQLTDGVITNRGSEASIALITAGLAITFLGFFAGLFAESRATGTVTTTPMKSLGAASIGLGIVAYLIALVTPRLLVDAYAGLVGFDCRSMPAEACGGLSEADVEARERRACGFYQWGLVGRAVGIGGVVLGTVLSFGQGMAPVGIFGVGTGLWQTGLFILQWEAPPPNCDPVNGYTP